MLENNKFHNLFPVPIFTGKFSDAENLKDILVPKFKEYEKNHTMQTKYSNNGYTSYGSTENILYWEECRDLVNEIGQTVANLHNHVGLPGQVYLEDSWFNINRKDSYHETHNHLPSIWSGCYYVQCNSETDAGITFLNSNFDSNWPFIRKEFFTDYTNSSSTFFNETGTFLIFPSYLKHRVEQQVCDSERVTISFNFRS